jgi:DNA polymerase-4
MTHNDAMLDIGKSIKQDIRNSLGEWVTVNIGISTNKFLAKYAAGFGKPDGMTLIDHTNLIDKYNGMKLVDLPGINVKFRARLRAESIFTPLEFLSADMNTLKKRVFKSINGYHWYMRLRGYETDTVEFSRKSIGHQHALSNKTTDMVELERLLLKLSEKTGRRLRKNNFYATGIHLYLGFVSDYQIDGPSSFENMPNIRSWHRGEKVFHRLYSTSDIYQAAKRILYTAEIPNKVKIMSVHVFGLEPWDPEQLSIFDTVQGPSLYSRAGGKEKVVSIDTDLRSAGARKRVSDAVDTINNRYGEFVITPAMMLDMQGTILDRIAFGQVKDL